MILYISLSVLVVFLLVLNKQGYWQDHQIVNIKWITDGAIILLCAGLSYTSIEIHKAKKARYIPIEADSLNQEDIDQLNIIDYSLAGQWDTTAKGRGKIVKNVAIYLIPFSLLLYIGSIKRRLVLFLIFSEGYVLTESLTGLAKGMVDRLRPFAYISKSAIENLSLKSKEDVLEDLSSYDISNSFFSGDASITAFGLMFFAYSFSMFYAKSKFKTLIWILFFVGIILECYFRVQSGKHFPTDVFAGAIVGSLIAWGILKIHKAA